MTQAFNLSQLGNFVNSSGQLNAAAGLYNQTAVANGGTGKATVTAGAILAGNGTSAMVEIGGTTAGTILAASPTGWAATAVSAVTGGDYILNAYTSPATWTKPAGLKAIKVTVVGAGGNGGPAVGGSSLYGAGGGGGGGGAAIRYIPAPSIPGPVAVTAGTGTNSFSTFASATSGANSSAAAAASRTAGGSGGVGSSGTINFNGSNGSNGIAMAPSPAGASFSGGSGGNSIFNGGGVFSSITAGPGVNASNFGGGGSGATQVNTTVLSGGTGKAGIVIVEEFY